MTVLLDTHVFLWAGGESVAWGAPSGPCLPRRD
jgi:hypothetical protein